jgi:antitoxin (DNA-binding transcriptional repressor) of toxin-antitoxin stability system
VGKGSAPAASGEEVIISKDQRPLVRLTPILGQGKQPQSGSARGMIHMATHFDEPLEDFKEYM